MSKDEVEEKLQEVHDILFNTEWEIETARRRVEILLRSIQDEEEDER